MFVCLLLTDWSGCVGEVVWNFWWWYEICCWDRTSTPPSCTGYNIETYGSLIGALILPSTNAPTFNTKPNVRRWLTKEPSEKISWVKYFKKDRCSPILLLVTMENRNRSLICSRLHKVEIDDVSQVEWKVIQSCTNRTLYNKTFTTSTSESDRHFRAHIVSNTGMKLKHRVV